MADQPIGISFMPSADAAANGPRQASVESGPGGSDLAAAFKILSLHLPRVLGAASIAPKRLLTSPGSAAIGGDAGANPYAQVFQALLQSMTGAMSPGGGPSSLSSLYGGGMSGGADLSGIGTPSGGGASAGVYTPTGGAPPPVIVPGSGEPRSGSGDPLPVPPPPTPSPTPTSEDRAGGNTYSSRYF